MDDPAQALQAVENALRLAVRAVCPEWQAKLDDTTRLEGKQSEEAKRRDGALVSNDLLDYVEFHQLTGLILKDWDAFKPIFDDKRRTETWFGALLDVRNAIAHSRRLLDYERHLTIGVSGQIRNQVTLYRTREQPSTAHYAVIERVQDNFGQVGLTEYELYCGGGQVAPRLEVGDTVTIECNGSDSRGREIEWIVRSQQMNDHITSFERATGTSAVMTITVAEEHVGESLTVIVFVRPVGARFTRHNKPTEDDHLGAIFNVAHDEALRLSYVVNPPNL